MQSFAILSNVKKGLLIVVLIIFWAVAYSSFVLSETPTPTPNNQQLVNLQKEIEDLQNKIKDAQGKIKSLSSQITVMDNQTRLTELKINEAKSQLKQLEKDIGILQGKISNLESSLDALSNVLLDRIIATYKTGTIEPWELIVSSNGFSDLLSRIQYIRIAQIQGKKLIYNTEQTKVDYANQKEIFEKKQQQIAALKKQLEAYTQQLAQQKKDKETLLEATRGDEQTYQEQLARARAEQAAILGIAAGLGKETQVGPIKTGEKVGTVIAGASACSSGTHLHFEVVKNGAHQDPVQYLKSISLTFDYDESQGRHFTSTGSWEWPLDLPIKINQDYGMTYWARIGWYNGGPHTGLDIFRDGANLFSSIDAKSAADGTLYRGSIACGGGTLLYARVDHADGVQSYYLHAIPK